MNISQTAMYFAEFGKLRKLRKDEGWTGQEIDEERHRITRTALGRDKSSKDFSNGDLDAVLARIKALVSPGDFAAQMRQQDSPDLRRASVEARIEAALDVIVIAPDPQFAGLRRGNYLTGTAKRICGKAYCELSDKERAKVMGALERSAAVKLRRKNEAEAARVEEADDNPF